MGMFARISMQRALRRRLSECRERLYWIAYAWCHDASLADDLVQDTLSKALLHADQLRDESAMDAWLLRILNNCWRDHFRNRHETIDIDEMEYVSEDASKDDHERDDIVTQVRRAVAALPEGQRQVLTLVDLEEATYAEVAEILGIPIGTVMSRLNRARQALKSRIMTEENRQKMTESRRSTLVSFRRKT